MWRLKKDHELALACKQMKVVMPSARSCLSCASPLLWELQAIAWLSAEPSIRKACGQGKSMPASAGLDVGVPADGQVTCGAQGVRDLQADRAGRPACVSTWQYPVGKAGYAHSPAVVPCDWHLRTRGACGKVACRTLKDAHHPGLTSCGSSLLSTAGACARQSLGAPVCFLGCLAGRLSGRAGAVLALVLEDTREQGSLQRLPELNASE